MPTLACYHVVEEPLATPLSIYLSVYCSVPLQRCSQRLLCGNWRSDFALASDHIVVWHGELPPCPGPACYNDSCRGAKTGRKGRQCEGRLTAQVEIE